MIKLILVICFVAIQVSFSNTQLQSNAGIIFLDDGQVATVKSVKDDATYFNPQNFFFEVFQTKNINAHYFKDIAGNFYASDKNGFIYKYDSMKVGSRLYAEGANYFTNENGRIYVLRADGLFVNYKSTQELSFYNIKLEGGQYFINGQGKLMIIDINGFVYDKNDFFTHTYKDIEIIGNNYFITNDQTLYTVGNVLDQDTGFVSGVLFSQKIKIDFSKVIFGGKFFATGYNKFFMIGLDGAVRSIDTNVFKKYSLEMTDFEYVGSNYLVSSARELFMVDDLAQLHFIKNMEKRVLKTDFKQSN